MSPTLPDPPVHDPTLDDWFAEQGEVEWGDDQEAAPAPFTAGGELEPATRAVPAVSARSSQTERRLAVIRRRRVVGLAALLALAVVGVAAGLAVFGSDEPAAPTTAPAATTQSPATTEPPPPTTTQPPRGTNTSPANPTSPLTIELPASGPLAIGARGEEVERLQTALRALQFNIGEVDGVFGEGTREAVRAFQRANDLPADGIIGETTAEALNAVLAERGITG